jgi:preprotein translocase subunit Sec63
MNNVSGSLFFMVSMFYSQLNNTIDWILGHVTSSKWLKQFYFACGSYLFVHNSVNIHRKERRTVIFFYKVLCFPSAVLVIFSILLLPSNTTILTEVRCTVNQYTLGYMFRPI